MNTFKTINPVNCFFSLLLSISFLVCSINAQAKDKWKHVSKKDVDAKYIIYRNNQKKIIFEYEVYKDVTYSLDTWLKTVNDKVSIAVLEEVDWVEDIQAYGDDNLRLYADGKWPIKDAQAFVKKTNGIKEDGTHWVSFDYFENNTSDAMKTFEIYNVSYSYYPVENSSKYLNSSIKGVVTIKVKKSPPFKIPKWLINISFPKATYKHMKRLDREVNKHK